MILFYNLCVCVCGCVGVCGWVGGWVWCGVVYVHKICDEKLGGCKKSFSWLGQKISKKIDGDEAYSHDADDSGLDLSVILSPWPGDDAASSQDISTPFSILIKFKVTEYSIHF